jgi:hypothetical protein
MLTHTQDLSLTKAIARHDEANFQPLDFDQIDALIQLFCGLPDKARFSS